ncbi:MAG: HGxxPAAW family protein [Aeromicrobium sp.]
MHGSSAAAWTAVIMALVGFTIGGIALVPDPKWPLFIVGVVVALVAGPVGLVMSRIGFGAERAPEHPR